MKINLNDQVTLILRGGVRKTMQLHEAMYKYGRTMGALTMDPDVFPEIEIEHNSAGSVDDFRINDWFVIAHYDNLEAGTTKWILGHEEGQLVMGEGATDIEALNNIREKLGMKTLGA